MLIIECPDQLREAQKFAEVVGLSQNLQEQLDYLGTYACHDDPEKTQCHLFPDFAPYSFFFRMHRKKEGTYTPWFIGGLIFHGNHDRGGDGGAPTFSVNLNPTVGWAIHT